MSRDVDAIGDREPEPPGVPSPTTIGISIAVPEPDGTYLQQRRADFGDHAAWRIPAHITLLPPTAVDAETYAAMREHCAKVAATHSPFEVVLRGTGTFRPVSDVVFIQVAKGVSACERLEIALRSGPVLRELAFYYHPHVTVAHDASAQALDRAFDELSGYSADFTVDSFHLYELGADDVWRPAEEFALGGG
ncbi:MAG TPA: 2'-5' RNA ligase family protein [Intrasporangium sp.]|uniref:2'-5' RNA ligase family protein n=1 Tax=Intrasporangium sp. TaxID=1925024 RepID=UPI002D77E41C|nr:2'-5' RNA ligase family protein [Intrasporangium sp.]HET7399826.1 2'-5' RNA ligase family protein [Intrasporangium sp.]